MDEFYLTRMGRSFFDGTMPSIAKSLQEISAKMNPMSARLIKSIECLADLAEEHIQEIAEMEDADLVGTYMMDLQRVKKFIAQCKDN